MDPLQKFTFIPAFIPELYYPADLFFKNIFFYFTKDIICKNSFSDIEKEKI